VYFYPVRDRDWCCHRSMSRSLHLIRFPISEQRSSRGQGPHRSTRWLVLAALVVLTLVVVPMIVWH